MAVNETIVTGRKYRKCIDAANKLWQRISFWTKASDVEFDDGLNAEEKISELNNSLTQNLDESLGGCILEQEGNDFYITGADSVRKKLGSQIINFGKVTSVNVSTRFSNYTSLKSSNFYIQVLSISAYASRVGGNSGNEGTRTITPSVSYNASTGIATVNNVSFSKSSSSNELYVSSLYVSSYNLICVV